MFLLLNLIQKFDVVYQINAVLLSKMLIYAAHLFRWC